MSYNADPIAAKAEQAARAASLRELSPDRMRQFHDYAEEYPNKRSALMMVLRLAEEEFGIRISEIIGTRLTDAATRR